MKLLKNRISRNYWNKGNPSRTDSGDRHAILWMLKFEMREKYKDDFRVNIIEVVQPKRTGESFTLSLSTDKHNEPFYKKFYTLFEAKQFFSECFDRFLETGVFSEFEESMKLLKNRVARNYWAKGEHTIAGNESHMIRWVLKPEMSDKYDFAVNITETLKPTAWAGDFILFVFLDKNSWHKSFCTLLAAKQFFSERFDNFLETGVFSECD